MTLISIMAVAAVVIIGLLVENLGFDTLERLTVRRWGMQR